MLHLSGLEGIFMFLEVVTNNITPSTTSAQQLLVTMPMNTQNDGKKEITGVVDEPKADIDVSSDVRNIEIVSVSEDETDTRRALVRKALSDSLPTLSAIRKHLIYLVAHHDYKICVNVIASAGRITLLDLCVRLSPI